MTIKRHMPWPLRAVFLAVVVGLGGAMAMWAYDLGRNNFAGLNPDGMRDQVVELKEQVKKLSAEREQLSTSANAAESQLNIERSAQAQLAGQIKTLVTENNKLKEDLSFFESLLPTNVGVDGITIQRLKAEVVVPNQVRYKLLAIQGEKGRQFVGNLQLSDSVAGRQKCYYQLPRTKRDRSGALQARIQVLSAGGRRIDPARGCNHQGDSGSRTRKRPDARPAIREFVR